MILFLIMAVYANSGRRCIICIVEIQLGVPSQGRSDTQIFGARKVSGMLVKGVSVCVIARRLHASYD